MNEQPVPGSSHPSPACGQKRPSARRPVTRHSRYVDLHLHSTCSDGLHAPEAVVAMAAGLGLAAIAIADHDNIDGIDAAMAAGATHGVEVLSGVELSVVWEGYDDIHLLGYGFDPHQEKLRRDLTAFQDFRARRNEMIVERVNEKLAAEGRGAIDFAAVREKAGGTVGRPHIAMALVEAGIVADSEAAFNRYLVPCNVAKRDFPIAEAIALIHGAGGVAVLAHPPFITHDFRLLTQMVEVFAGMGMDGLEAWNSGADNQTVDQTITLARRNGLIVTGGTDFHGTDGEKLIFGGVRGNLRIPYRCVEEIRERCRQRQGIQ